MYSEREPIWNEENKNKRKGDTTFQTCGWCKYRGSGVYRYDCMIEGKCNLLPSYSENVYFDTPCKILVMGKKDIESIIRAKRYEIQEKQYSIKMLMQQIAILQGMYFDDMPPLPSNRRYNHFNIGDRIMVLYNGKWESATVINGYRHHDGCISYRADKKLHNGDYLDGHGGSGGIARPEFLLKSEYDWFKEHPERFKQWIEMACSRKYNSDMLNPCDFPIPS